MSNIDLEIATTYAQRMRGVIGKEKTSALLIKPAYFSIHTFGVRNNLEVAFLDGELNVYKIKTLPPNRIVWSWRCRAVLEAPAGSFEKWGITAGVRLELGDK